MYLFITLIFCTCNWISINCNKQSQSLEVFKYIPSLNGLQCYGDDISLNSSRSSLLSCATECTAVEDCFWFAYDRSSETCVGCIASTKDFLPGAVGIEVFVAIFIGLTDEAHVGNWTWIVGGDEASYTNWKNKNVPTNENRLCATTNADFDYKWNGASCGANKKVLCEI